MRNRIVPTSAFSQRLEQRVTKIPPFRPPLGETQGNTFPCTPVARRGAGPATGCQAAQERGRREPPVKAEMNASLSLRGLDRLTLYLGINKELQEKGFRVNPANETKTHERTSIDSFAGFCITYAQRTECHIRKGKDPSSKRNRSPRLGTGVTKECKGI